MGRDSRDSSPSTSADLRQQQQRRAYESAERKRHDSHEHEREHGHVIILSSTITRLIGRLCMKKKTYNNGAHLKYTPFEWLVLLCREWRRCGRTLRTCFYCKSTLR